MVAALNGGVRKDEAGYLLEVVLMFALACGA